MTIVEINKAIAEACGWTNIRWYHPVIHIEPFESSEWRGIHPLHGCVRLPNFHKSLDWMREAVASLSADQRVTYIAHLDAIVHKDKVFELPMSLNLMRQAVFAIANASASQCAEAFLKTVGKWQEEVTSERQAIRKPRHHCS